MNAKFVWTTCRLWVASALVALAVPAVQAGDQDFTVVNQTGVEIHHLFVSPSSKNNWEEDILGEDTLPNGEEVDIEFDTEETAELWDLKIADGEKNSIVWTQLNLLQISKITLIYDAETKKATAKVE